MANETAQSNLSPSNNKQGSVVQSRQFKITDIPDAMDKMGWPVSAKLMRHWFKGRPWDTPDGGMDRDVKYRVMPGPERKWRNSNRTGTIKPLPTPVVIEIK